VIAKNNDNANRSHSYHSLNKLAQIMRKAVRVPIARGQIRDAQVTVCGNSSGRNRRVEILRFWKPGDQ